MRNINCPDLWLSLVWYFESQRELQVNTTKFANISAIKKRLNEAVVDAGDRKKRKFKEGTCCKSTKTNRDRVWKNEPVSYRQMNSTINLVRWYNKKNAKWPRNWQNNNCSWHGQHAIIIKMKVKCRNIYFPRGGVFRQFSLIYSHP